MRILQLISMVRSLLSSLGMSITDLMTIIQKIMSIGIPPTVSDETALRAWLRRVAEVANELAVLTPVQLDNAIAGFIMNVVTDDAAWATFYSVISMFFASDAVTRTAEIEVSAIAGCEKLATQLTGEAAKLDPATIMMLIKFIIDLIRSWKK